MRTDLAESLLGRVMGWTQARLVEELPLLDRMARFKYDEYLRFAPGRKFLENLGLWLSQFASPAERETAYDFVKHRLVFISGTEMRHLVEAAFSDVIKPGLMREAAAAMGLPRYRLGNVIASDSYHRAERASLFLGLSDGAHMDMFRRAAGLNNEQVWQAYELSGTKAGGMLKDLREALDDAEACFKRVFLLDDFTASGRSYLRLEGSDWKGKIAKAIDQFAQGGEAQGLVNPEAYEMTVIIYVATPGALDHINRHLRQLYADRPRRLPKVEAVYELPAGTELHDGRDHQFLELVDDDRYYRTRELDHHERVGGTDTMKRGFAGCCLPVVLTHNTPNNSVYLLWGDPTETASARGLFPRITRHRSEA
jgi:hypothetical protein